MRIAQRTFWQAKPAIMTALSLVIGLGPAYAAKKMAERATSASLGGADRYLVHVSTDKPIYRTGEMVYGRGVLLHALNRTPLQDAPPTLFTVVGPKGDTITSGYAQTQESVAGFGWKIPDGQAGGEYTLKVTCPQLGIPPAERKFDIRAYRAPRLKTQIVFLRDGYGPGDTVSATLDATRAEGGVPADANVTVTARLDGKEVHRSTTVIDRDGICSAQFDLPASIARGEGTVAFAIEDGGVVETATKTIPILLQTVDLSIYPEGGELVAGLANRLYIEAKTPAGKPADLAGIVVDAKGEQVATFRTEHEGRGCFTFKPADSGKCILKITEPSGIKTEYPLPPVRESGVVISATERVYPAGEPVSLQVQSSIKGAIKVTLSKREVEVAALTVKGNQKAGRRLKAEVTLTPAASADGILVATAWDADGNPLSERLIYREPAQKVQVEVVADRDRYVPGGKAQLTLRTTDAEGEPISAVVGLTVTDDSVLEMIETREQAPRLPVMVLLEDDVKELADAHVYLDRDNPESAQALDLLLGTQGWRRFAFIDSAAFVKQHGDAGRRVLALRVVTARDRQALLGQGGWGFRGMKGGIVDRVEEDFVMEAVPDAAVPMPEGAEAPDQPVEDIKKDEKPRDGREKQDARLEEPSAIAKPVIMADKELREAAMMAEVEANEEIIAPRKRLNSRRSIAYMTVRLYAHQVRAGRRPGDRVDFTETLYWNAAVKTDAKSGEATVAFDLNDSVTSFRVLSDAFAKSGALGSGSATIESVKPFYIEPKLPLAVTMGDRIVLPIGVVNGTSEELQQGTLTLADLKGIETSVLSPFSLAADQRIRRLVELSVGDITGSMDVVLNASAGGYADRVTRPLRVVPRGFPIEVAHGGMLTPDGAVEFSITVPESRTPGSVSSDIAVYPTPLANLTEALERLIREPCGCFEQTSSSTYPLVMAQQYFMSHQGVDPKLVERSKALLSKGYKRLTGFECKQKGYEWFGGDPAHEALTAYGLLEFSDMAKVSSEVDQGMLKRTREWLLKARDGKGGFERKRRALHTWITDPDCSNGYIVWALLESGEPAANLRKEIDSIKAAAMKSSNSYVLALGANIALLDKDSDAARTLMSKLAQSQSKDGYVDGATTSIVGSGGTALQVETTGLAVLAWLQDANYAGNVETSMRWLADSCKSGRYGSTQSTVLALRAIVAYDKARSKPEAPGSLQLFIDGHRAGSAVSFDKETKGAIKLTDIAEMLEPGTHKVRLAMTGGSEMPFALTVNYSDDQPDSSEACKVGIEVELVDGKLDEGDVTEIIVHVDNRTDKALPTPIAIVGVPGGLEVRHDQLKELVKSGKIAAYEVLGREVVLYWRSFEGGQDVTLPISLVAEIPGTYTGPASRAYEYYTDEHKSWCAPVRADIAPKQK